MNRYAPDVMGAAGAVLVGVGLWMIAPAAALIGAGVLLVIAGVGLAWRRAEGHSE